MGNDDHALIRAVLAGDKDAYGPLVARHSQSVFRVAFRITENEADAEEVVQETFLRGYRNLGDFDARANLSNLDLPDRYELRTGYFEQAKKQDDGADC